MTDAFHQLPTLTAARLRLRQLLPDDRDALYAVYADPVAMRYWSRPPMRDPAEAAALIAEIEDYRARGSLLQWGVEVDGQIIGSVTLFYLNPAQGRAEVGYILRSDRWGQGYATEAVARLLQHAQALGLRRIEADVDPRNTPSLRLMQRLGFRREGLLKARWCVAGEIQDSVLLGRLLTPPAPQPGFVVSCDPADVDIDRVHQYLSEHSYWARGIPRALVERAAAHSLNFSGLLDGVQVAYARVISDYATFANLVDVYVLPELRGRGYSARLMEAVTQHPDLQGLRRMTLATRDAHGLYARYGFGPVEGSTVLMQRYQPDLYTRPSTDSPERP